MLESVGKGTEGFVLLVEDENSVRQLVRRILEKGGFRVRDAATPAAALALFEEDPAGARLLLSDVVMPGMNGFDLAERILAVRPDLPVLFMSGYTTEDLFQRGIRDAGRPFLAKPFRPPELVEMVRRVLDEAGGQGGGSSA